MGAGYRCGPQCGGQAGQAGRQERCEQQLRHEHAIDEQRIRHGNVAQCRLRRTLEPTEHPAAGIAARELTRSPSVLGQLHRQSDVFGNRHFLGTPLHVERAAEAALRQPLPQGIAQQLAAL